MSDDQEILFEQKGQLGNNYPERPKALNALTHEMTVALDKQLSSLGGG